MLESGEYLTNNCLPPGSMQMVVPMQLQVCAQLLKVLVTGGTAGKRKHRRLIYDRNVEEESATIHYDQSLPFSYSGQFISPLPIYSQTP